MLLAAQIERKQDGQLWQMDEPELYRVQPQGQTSRSSGSTRYTYFVRESLKSSVPCGNSTFKAGIDLYNENRKQNISPILLKTFKFEESMSTQ